MSEDEREDLRLDRITAQQLQHRSRQTARLTMLLDQRRDLAGVHALADVVEESVRWSA